MRLGSNTRVEDDLNFLNYSSLLNFEPPKGTVRNG
jgi:hypothetical protein